MWRGLRWGNKEGTQVFVLNTWLNGVNFTDARTLEKDVLGRGRHWRFCLSNGGLVGGA